ncbi:MAG: YfhO family protein [Candidatus Levyibacteriota bacterium]|nr:MAG: YfhO family protein [Candidatus Levybacteria bacterium]
MKNNIWFIVIFFVIATGIIFRSYFISAQVPFPANLLVQFYQPWASYPKADYIIGPTQKPLGFDSLRIFYPTRRIVVDQLSHAIIPLWNPYSFSGNVLHATYQSAVFFPLSFLFFILPPIDAWSVIVMLSPILTGVFTYLFLQELSLGKKASFFGAITYAFCGIMIVWWEEMFMAVYAMLVLPLVCYSIHRLYRNTKRLDFIILFGALSSSIFAGWFQATLYVFVCGLLWAIFLYFFYFRNKRSARLIAIAFFLSILFSAVQLIPALEVYLHSSRQYLDTKEIFNNFLSPTSQLITFIAPDFFGNPGAYNYFGKGFYHEKTLWIGISALLFVLYELLSRKKTKIVSFFLLLGAATLSLGFNLPTTWFFLYTLHPPFISETTPGRIFFLSSFCFAVAAAYGMQRYLKKASFFPMLFSVICIGILFIFSYVFLFSSLKDRSYSIALHNMILPTIIFVLAAAVVFVGFYKRLRSAAWIGIVIISLIGIFYFANKYLYFSQRRFVFPQSPVFYKLQEVAGIDRFWSFGNGRIFSNFSNIYGLYSVEGYDSLNIARYNELLFSSHTKGRFIKFVPRNDATLYPANTWKDIYGDNYRKRLLSLLGVKYIASLHATDSASLSNKTFQRIWTDGVYDISSYEDAIPRYFLANEYIVEKDNQKILSLIYDNNFDMLKTLILEEEPDSFVGNKKNLGKVTLLSYTPNKISFQVNTIFDALLFLSDNYYPGWKSFIDNKERKIYRADYSFRSVVIPAGTHTVTFAFQPRSFYAGVILTLAGFILFLLLLVKKVWRMI